MNINSKISSPNYSIRQGIIHFIVIHYTEMTLARGLEKLCDPNSKVSAHYLIKSNGEILKLVDEQFTAWHAGVSYWLGYEKLNEFSIGIELDNSGYDYYPIEQMNSCMNLCKKLSSTYNILSQNILGHSDIAPNRKLDPGLFFDWSYLAKHRLGIWPNVALDKLEESVLFNFGDYKPEILSLQNNLQKLGYKIDLTGIFDQQTNYVVRAFQAHFYPAKIQKLGLDFYRNNNSKYSWDNISNKILVSLVYTQVEFQELACRP